MVAIRSEDGVVLGANQKGYAEAFERYETGYKQRLDELTKEALSRDIMLKALTSRTVLLALREELKRSTGLAKLSDDAVSEAITEALRPRRGRPPKTEKDDKKDDRKTESQQS